MYNVVQIQECFKNLVGFQQFDDPQYPQLGDDLLISTSGKYVQNTHPLCTPETLYNIAPEFYGFNYPGWDKNAAYKKGAIVTVAVLDGDVYKCIADVAQNLEDDNPTPNVDPTHWKKQPLFDGWLEDVYKGACSNLVSELLKHKKINNVGKSLIQSMQLYTGFGMLEDKVIKKNRFVGFQIEPNKVESLLIRIDKIGLQVDTIQEIDFYLYHSSQTDPLDTFTIDVTRANSFTWANFKDCLLSYMKGNQNASGTFYLGYYEEDLAGQAIFKEANLMAPCMSCNGQDIALFNAWSKHMKIEPFFVLPAGLNEDRSLFNEDRVNYSTTTNWGINLSITVMCDLTEFFCKNSALFADALAMQICLDFLQKIAYNTRMNVISDKTKQLAMADLDSNLKSGSFKAEYIKALMALDTDFSGFDSTCLPCNSRRGITYGAW